MGVVAVFGLVFDMRGRDGDAARLLLRRLVDLVVGRVRRPAGFRQHLGDRRRQRRLAMVDVTDGPDVAMRLGTFKLCFGHSHLSLSPPPGGAALKTAAGLLSENAPVQARTSGPILSSPCRLSAVSRHGSKKNNRETSMNAQAATRQASPPQTPQLPEARPESLGLSPARLQSMSDAFKREIDKGTTPGVTVMVARRGQIGWFEALGRQNPAASAPMARDSIFRIYSMTKPIVSVGIMQLVEDGYLLLGEPLAKYIPEFS